MAGRTLTVPAEYGEALRSAVVSEIGFWSKAVKKDLAEIREAREGRDDHHAALVEGDLGDHQRALGDAGALAEQLPAPGSNADARPIWATAVALSKSP